MGSFANSLFTLLLGWLQGIVSAIWSAFTSQNGSSMLKWIGQHWIVLAAILCIIGLVVDLSVYIIRWKPFRVWRSFFNKKDSENEPEYTDSKTVRPVFRREEPVHMKQGENDEPVFRKRADRESEPDFSQWEPEEELPEPEHVPQVKEPPTITNAGYVVPADSPYRRPADQMPKENPFPPEYENTGTASIREEREGPVPVTQRRRRRISVSELFSDPEEELQQFDAPQHVIDSRKAYHAPVYPRGWKKNEEDEK